MASLKLLSVDWDYCVPIHSINTWDCGEFLKNLYSNWVGRKHTYIDQEGYLQKESLKNIQPEKKTVPIPYSEKLMVAESHSTAYQFFSRIIVQSNANQVTLYHFDLHHDVWGQSDIEVCSENWLYKLIVDNPSVSWNIKWIIPPWANDLGYKKLSKSFIHNIKRICNKIRLEWVIEEGNLENKNEIHSKIMDGTIICRSGGWTPPQLDKEFVRLVNKFKTRIINSNSLQVNEMAHFSPMTPRKLLIS